ncbi:hypothetical protein CAOG_00842 [Capsaspora owczarzaki ATCC 30864]|uniref:Cytochrome c oxidase assembly factor 3 mitochondrial coiled-coil domain-containing protein n=1 Tax=Capsaspora owczarzaki (strain ATCC 30864) TaxID=595528 RepID=A0A0D2U298_CAPO3|nr:hypothetical protein CAOG_00842 [Capsaspora owczarzaki ATCC 30864]KJE89351.1 hypothetical protein CAOG_000842 [Capsaspora owczarzaki ATCC 30864]|eukprot:XP_004365713.1 hypothetical protein CAOG_00842 [Capsaspora owczarzaki ATCC 30864]
MLAQSAVVRTIASSLGRHSQSRVAALSTHAAALAASPASPSPSSSASGAHKRHQIALEQLKREQQAVQNLRREQARGPNIRMALGLLLFVVGAYAYTLSSVRQEDFTGVDASSASGRPVNAPPTSASPTASR